MHTIEESFATGEEINVICTKIESVLGDVKTPHAIISLLSLAIVLMNPEISQEKLSDTVAETSKFICMYMEDPEPGATKEKMN